MSTNPSREHPSTYFVQDRSNLDEMARLSIQDQMLTASMGGVLAEQTDPAKLQQVLDVGCGTGGWLIETAKTYPTISTLIGVDISSKILEYAREQAEIQQVSNRVDFRGMDALLMLEFPNNSFDMVNQRFCASFLRTWEWTKLLGEYQRVTRTGGVIRITELDRIPESSSPALTRLSRLLTQALYQAGHLFDSEHDGVACELERLLSQHGIQNIQTRSHILEYRAGTPEGLHFYEDMSRIFRTIVPFIRKWRRLPEDYDAIYQQALTEMQQPDFSAEWSVLTAWGEVPAKVAQRHRR